MFYLEYQFVCSSPHFKSEFTLLECIVFFKHPAVQGIGFGIWDTSEASIQKEQIEEASHRE